jgi:hypothetical protein
MRTRIIAILVLFSLSGCASTLAVSPTSATLQRLLIAQQIQVPDDWIVTGHSHAAPLTRLLAWAEDRNIIVAPAHLAEKHRVLGFAHESHAVGWIVLLDEDLPPNARLHTLVHEVAHILSPARVFNEMQASEIFAEIVAVQVCDQLGLDTWHQTAAYLRHFTTPEMQTLTATRYRTDIDHAVETLTKAAQP